MENNEKTIFLTAPAGMFNSIAEAQKCGRALQAMLNYNYDNLNIAGNRILIGISNVDADIAHYESVKNGVGRPKRILQGDLENCFVDPHIHVLIHGDKAEKISSIIIDYLIKKSKKYGFDVGKLIWKEYPKTDSDIARVEFYIERQSFSRLSVNRECVGNQKDELQIDDVIKSDDALFFESFGECDVSEKLDLFEYLEDSKVVTEGGANAEFEQDLFNFNSISCADKNIRNTVVQMDVDYFIADLRTKWRYLQQMKKIAVELIANHEMAYYASYLQNDICQIADAVKKNKFNIYTDRIREITLKIEEIGIAIEVQKKVHQFAMVKRSNLTSDDIYPLNYCGN